MTTERIKNLIQTCNIHKTRLKTALVYLEKTIPITISKYETLTNQEISFIDQMSYITHEYSDKTKDIVEGINQLFDASRRLIEIYDKIYKYLSDRGILE